MSAGMILNITADSTERRPTTGARSPEPDTKQVVDEPYPSNKCDDPEEETSKVLVSGGHLGGMANVAFEDEEDSGDSVDAKKPQVWHSIQALNGVQFCTRLRAIPKPFASTPYL